MLIQEIWARKVVAEEGLDSSVKVIHASVPKTFIGDREFSLVFPRFLFSYNCSKCVDSLFIGKITPSRESFLKAFPSAVVVSSLRGRDKKVKGFDEDYFLSMSSARFVLCPDGDFIWTYRFFESIIFKAIPVVENDSFLYSGFKFYRKGDDLVYREDWVVHNLEKLKREMTWGGVF